MLIGYARVSTEDQNLDLQRDALTAAGCERIFEDKASGTRDDRPGLAEALSHLRKGDCLVIWRLDRLGRRMIALLEFVEELRRRGCHFRILDGSFPIDMLRGSSAVSEAFATDFISRAGSHLHARSLLDADTQR